MWPAGPLEPPLPEQRPNPQRAAGPRTPSFHHVSFRYSVDEIGGKSPGRGPVWVRASARVCADLSGDACPPLHVREGMACLHHPVCMHVAWTQPGVEGRPGQPGPLSGPELLGAALAPTLSWEQAGWGKKYLPGFYSPFLNVRVAHIYLSVSKNLLTLKSEDPLCRAGRQRATPKTVLGGTSVSPKFTR